MKNRHALTLVLSVGFLLLLGSGTALADEIVNISVNTSPLTASSAGPFTLQFQLTDGSGGVVADGNNTVTISNFNFGGGSGPSGPISLTDNSFLVFSNSGFIPGSSLSFVVDLTTNLDLLAPDEFSFFILTNDPINNPLTTIDVGGSLALVDLGTSHIQSFVGTGAFAGVDATAALATPTPEPSSLLLLGTGLLVLVLLSRRLTQLTQGRPGGNWL